MQTLVVDTAAETLLEAIDRCVGPWVERAVREAARRAGHPLDQAVAAAARRAGEDARVAVIDEMRALLASDVDEQRGNPLTVLRNAVRFPTEVLRAVDVPPPARDEFAQRVFPGDVYGLAPATWSDVDPSLTGPGIMWGAWKAATVLERRRREGRR